MHPGRGPGLTPRSLGEKGGVETVTLSEQQMPNHNHIPYGLASSPASTNTPASDRVLARSVGGAAYTNSTSSLVSLNNNALQATGGNRAHNNLQPFLSIYFIIALQGTYPSRS